MQSTCPTHVIYLSTFDNFKAGARSGVSEGKHRFELDLRSEVEYDSHTNVLWMSVSKKDVESLHVVAQDSEYVHCCVNVSGDADSLISTTWYTKDESIGSS